MLISGLMQGRYYDVLTLMGIKAFFSLLLSSPSTSNPSWKIKLCQVCISPGDIEFTSRSSLLPLHKSFQIEILSSRSSGG
jgi:hypothetical protein